MNTLYNHAVNPELIEAAKLAREKKIAEAQEAKDILKQWNQHPLTRKFLTNIISSRDQLLHEAMIDSDTLTDDTRTIVLNKLKEAKTLTKVINYANGTNTSY